MDTTSERGKCRARGLKKNRKEIRQGRQVIKIWYRRRVARQPQVISIELIVELI